MPEYRIYQTAASESLRQAGDLGCTIEERLIMLDEAAEYAAKAFLAAKDNVYFRYLAMSQYTCAEGLKLLVRTNYDSRVVTAKPPEDYTHA